MKKLLVIGLFLFAHLGHAETIELKDKYVTYCTLSAQTIQEREQLSDGSILNRVIQNFVYVHLADSVQAHYNPSEFGITQYRVLFNVDGGTAYMLYQFCKEHKQSREPVRSIEVKPDTSDKDSKGEFIGVSFDEDSGQ